MWNFIGLCLWVHTCSDMINILPYIFTLWLEYQPGNEEILAVHQCLSSLCLPVKWSLSHLLSPLVSPCSSQIEIKYVIMFGYLIGLSNPGFWHSISYLKISVWIAWSHPPPQLLSWDIVKQTYKHFRIYQGMLIDFILIKKVEINCFYRGFSYIFWYNNYKGKFGKPIIKWNRGNNIVWYFYYDDI